MHVNIYVNVDSSCHLTWRDLAPGLAPGVKYLRVSSGRGASADQPHPPPRHTLAQMAEDDLGPREARPWPQDVGEYWVKKGKNSQLFS